MVESPPFQGGIKRVRVPSGIQLTGCISVGRLLALDARGRWFESTHPDNLGLLKQRAATHVEIIRMVSKLYLAGFIK